LEQIAKFVHNNTIDAFKSRLCIVFKEKNQHTLRSTLEVARACLFAGYFIFVALSSATLLAIAGAADPKGGSRPTKRSRSEILI